MGASRAGVSLLCLAAVLAGAICTKVSGKMADSHVAGDTSAGTHAGDSRTTDRSGAGGMRHI